MAKETKVKVSTPGVDEGKRDMDEFGRSVAAVGKKTDAAGRKGAEGMDKLNKETQKSRGIFSGFITSLKSWALGIVTITASVAAFTRALRANRAEMQENAQVALEQQKQLLRLQYLGGLFREKPELRKEVAAYAEYGRRPFDEVADAWYNLRSKGGALTSQQRTSILMEALELGRTDPEANLQTLIDMFSLYVKKTGELDINRVQNVLLQTITEAGGGLGDVAKYMPQFLPLGLTGGLTGPQAAGVWSYATTQTAEASLATSGLRAAFMGLQGKGTPESQRLLRKMGVRPGMGFFQQVDILSQQYRAGRFDLGMAEQLAGREGASLFLDILKDPAAMLRTVGIIEAADRGDIDITADMITELMGDDELARLEEEDRLYGVGIENLKAQDIDAVRIEAYKKRFEYRWRREGLPAWRRHSAWWLRRLMLEFPAPYTIEEQIEQLEKQDTLTPFAPTTVIHNVDNRTQYFPRPGDPNEPPPGEFPAPGAPRIPPEY